MRYLCLLILLALPLTVFAQQTISYGETVTGSVTTDTPVQEYQFEGTAGDVITILMEATTGSSLDSYLRLLDSSSAVLAENDDASDVTIDAEIASFELPASDTFTIQATRFGLEGGISEGEFQLTLTLESGTEQESTPEATETPVETTESAADTIFYNMPVSGRITLDNDEDTWQFTGTEGDVITIRMSRENDGESLDTFLYLLDSEGDELAQNDDSALSDDLSTSEILNFELPYTGIYTVVATRYGGAEGTSVGDYTLEILTRAVQAETPESISETETPAETPIVFEGQEISYGTFVMDTANAESKFYLFEAESGDVVTVSAKRQSGDFDPAITLKDSSGNLIASNSRFNGASDARIVNVELSGAGTYQIEVVAERGSSGNFVLYLAEAETAISAATPEPEATQETVEAAPTEAATSEAAPDFSNAVLKITLSWNSSADFDLQVTDPDGTTIDYFNAEADSGGVFGGDANGGCGQTVDSPTETVFWNSEPPVGTYEIGVAYVFPCGASDPVPFTITISMNGEIVETIEGELNQGQFESYEWTLAE